MIIPKTQIARGVFRIGPLPTGNARSAEAPTSPFIVCGQERAAILEPGERGHGYPTLQAIGELGIDLDRIAYIIITHIHLHHFESINTLVKEIPRAKIVVHQRAVPHLLDPTRLNESTNQIWGEVGGHCGRLDPVPEDRILGVVGGEVFDLGQRELDVLDLRGHAPHQIGIFDRMTRAMWIGDMCGHQTFASERGGPDILAPMFDVRQQLESLNRCRALKPAVFFTFSGGGVTFAPEVTMKWQEDEVLAIERICLEGMKQKLTAQEIGKRLVQDRDKRPRELTYSPIFKPSAEPSVHLPGLLHRLGEDMPPFGMIAYLKREHPELEWPKGMPGGQGAGRGL
ncbi:MAG: MBL fold metallo-hydrolase [Chloroflexi bacterium]|nr:MBL fold metallo-hydrolase [Chloroflexota bacterium]